MLYRKLSEVIGTDHDVNWGNGTSRRLVVDSDGRGYAVTETFVRAGTRSSLRYDRHLESCYCIEGSGQVECAAGVFTIEPGTLYAPDKGEEHHLSATTDMRLVCVFNPPLRGDENHSPVAGQPSGY